MTNINKPSAKNVLEAQRELVRKSLNEITAQLNTALVQAGLAYPVYMCVPTTGNSLLTFACPLDPSDDDWRKMGQIACEIVGKKVSTRRLITRSLACAMAGTAMGAAELTID